MAQTGAPEPSQHTFNPDATLDAFAYGDSGAIPGFAYEIQSSSDAFKYASSLEKRDRLLDELLKRKDSLFEVALACMLFKVHKVYTFTGILDDELFRTALCDHLTQSFPKKVATFQNSLAKQTIRVLESFLSQFTTSSFAEVHQEHQRAFWKINQAFVGFESMAFSPPPSPVKEKGPGRPRRMSQQELKRARVKQPSVDEKPFQILGVPPPRSPQEYEEIIERVMVTLKSILSVSTSLRVILCREYLPSLLGSYHEYGAT